MSAVLADPASPELALLRKMGRKRKLLIGAAALLALVLVLLGVATTLWLRNKAAHAAEEAGNDEVALADPDPQADPARPPTFLPLEVFVVNLADKEAGRYAQVGITLEVESAIFADQMKGFMPAIRNSILMILAHKTSQELLDRAGKEQLADEIMREIVRPMGIRIDPPRPIGQLVVEAAQGSASAAASSAPSGAASAAQKAPAARKSAHNPVRHVHFSNFIVQ
jgi:flagellar FliL protein